MTLLRCRDNAPEKSKFKRVSFLLNPITKDAIRETEQTGRFVRWRQRPVSFTINRARCGRTLWLLQSSLYLFYSDYLSQFIFLSQSRFLSVSLFNSLNLNSDLSAICSRHAAKVSIELGPLPIYALPSFYRCNYNHKSYVNHRTKP